jgi:hypothetical protein
VPPIKGFAYSEWYDFVVDSTARDLPQWSQRFQRFQRHLVCTYLSSTKYSIPIFGSTPLQVLVVIVAVSQSYKQEHAYVMANGLPTQINSARFLAVRIWFGMPCLLVAGTRVSCRFRSAAAR